MRQLSGCDFCGGTASGTFEVLPAEYDPESAGKRMLLCDHCRDALSSILDPLLDAKGVGDVEPTDVEPDVGGDTVPGAATASADGSSSIGDVDDTGSTDDDDSGADEAQESRSDDATEMAATGAGSSSSVPKGYRKVLRFLENREFPIDREDAVEMTAGAYGLSEEAVSAAIDHAVDHGRLSEFDGELKQG